MPTVLTVAYPSVDIYIDLFLFVTSRQVTEFKIMHIYIRHHMSEILGSDPQLLQDLISPNE